MTPTSRSKRSSRSKRPQPKEPPDNKGWFKKIALFLWDLALKIAVAAILGYIKDAF